MTTYVYVITATDHETLYVGHTRNLKRRTDNHRREDWGHRIGHVTAHVFRDKDRATAMERALIVDLEPEFNVQGNPRHMSWPDYLDWIGEHDAADAARAAT